MAILPFTIPFVGIAVLVCALVLPAFADSGVKLTPFDVLVSPKDFDTQGPNHQVLILHKNESASIPITIINHDTFPHDISLEIPLIGKISDFIEKYSFDPQTVHVPPNSEKHVLLNLKVQNNATYPWLSIDLVARDQIFGMVGKYFFLVIGDKNDKNKIFEINSLMDHSLRIALPGAAFPYLEKTSEKTASTMITNSFGLPKYLPKDYQFQGVSNLTNATMLVYSPAEVTNSTESIDFTGKGGMLIDYITFSQNFNLTNWMTEYIARNEAQEIRVNGMDGIAIEQKESTEEDGQKFKSPSEIIFSKKNTQVELNGNMTLTELLKVAASIPVTEELLVPSPLKQFKSGIKAEDVKCKQDFRLVIRSGDGSPGCLRQQTALRLVYFGWGQMPSTSVFFSESNSTRQIVDMSSALRLDLSVNPPVIQPGQQTEIKISVNNPLPNSINVTVQNNWLYENVLLNPCQKIEYGIAILEGYYAIQNLTEGKTLDLYGITDCITLVKPMKAYQFQPRGDQVREIVCERSPCFAQTYELASNYRVDKYWEEGKINSQFFKPDSYTVVGADEWGHMAIRHFVVTN